MAIETIPWWKGAVFYSIYPLSFKDSNGDGVGDLGGIIERLDYLNDGTEQSVGVDAIWLTPIFPTANADYGYDVMDYRKIDPFFGDLKTFRCLLQEAHRRGIKVLLDFVPNHTSSRHPWFLESRFSRQSAKYDWYIWHDPVYSSSGISYPPTDKKSVFGGSAWTFDEMRGQYYFHQFYREQPDLNWRNPKVRREMLKVLPFWLKLGIDGFRFDAVPHLKRDYFADISSAGIFLEKYRIDSEEMHRIFRDFRRVLDEFPDRVSIAEVYAPPEELVHYYGKNDEFHMAFNFGLLSITRGDLSAENVRRVIEETEGCFVPRGAWPNYALGNLDRSRIASRYGKDLAALIAMLQLTLRGSPTLYYGEEIGMSDAFIPYGRRRDRVGRDKVRTPMQWDASAYAGFSKVEPWLPVHPNFPEINVQQQMDDPHSLLSLYRKLIWTRKRHPALRYGTYRTVDSPNPACFAYLRGLGSEKYLVALNFSRSEQRVAFPGFKLTMGSVLASTARDRGGWVYLKDFSLQPYEGCLIRLPQ